jgi:3-hydroxyisobutyrate dehydrogenase-like beta-hydroxyacid dehydrogenase
MIPMKHNHIALIGLGEVGGIFGAALVQQGIKVTAYDRQDMSAFAATIGVHASASMPQALAGATRLIADEIKRWATVMRDSGIKPD